MQIDPQTLDAILRIVTWLLVGFGALWLITSTIGYFHRRSYNLTHAESGGSKNIKPDFLRVDEAKRKQAIERGQAYDEVLGRREAVAPPPAVATLGGFARVAAGASAIVALLVMILTTITKAKVFQGDIDRVLAWDEFTRTLSENKMGAVVAVAVIAANAYTFYEGSKKWARRAPAKP
jgi:hypothetical protein